MGVTLVGAGPGSADFLTLAAVRALSEADIVVADRLIDQSVLDLVPPGVEIIELGKGPGESAKQGLINEVLIQLSSQFERVVRLKGGDPFIFGRGGEEVLALRAAGVSVKVIPGLSSALVAPLLADIPLTHRAISRGFFVVTGHTLEGDCGQFSRLVLEGMTMVILMGVEHRGEIASQLIAAGAPSSTPVAVISRASWRTQQVVTSTLEKLGSTDVEAPSVIVVGAVVHALHPDVANIAEFIGA